MATTDIFGRSGNDFGGSFSADAAKIIFATGGSGSPTAGASGGVGLLCQNLQVSYQKQVTKIYEVGSTFAFYLEGRAQGMAGMSRVMGPRPVQTQFYRNYGDVCNAANNNINFSLAAGCKTDSALAKLNLLIKNVVLVSIAFTVAAADMVVNEQLQSMFMALDAQDAS